MAANKREWSPERRAAHAERLREAHAKRKAERAADATTVLPSKDEAAEELRAFASELYTVANDRAARNRVLDKLEDFMSRLSAKDYPDLAESPIVQKFIERLAERAEAVNRDDPPGTIYNRGAINERKKPWTDGDLRKSDIPILEFEVHEPECVVWNSIRRDYQPGITYTDYRCFYDLIREKNRNMRLAHEHAEYLFRQRNVLTDPSIANLGSARVRGSADTGSYRPAAGLFVPSFEGGESEE